MALAPQHHLPQAMPPLFIADVHLGRLARQLRMLGFDTLFDSHITKPELLKVAATTQRILLTRAAIVDKNPFIQSLIISSEIVSEQLRQVVDHLKLQPYFRPFSRCMMCNELVHPVKRENILSQLPPATATSFTEFWQCPQCKRIYWKGAHYNRMQQLIESLSH